MMRDESLGGGVVLVEVEPCRAHVVRPDALAWREPLELGDLDLDHEAVIGLEVRGG